MSRRTFLKRLAAGGTALALGPSVFREVLRGSGTSGLRVGFPNDTPVVLGRFSRPAAHAIAMDGGLVRCVLCPHECILAEGDRGFCRTRAVRNGALHTLAYGNACTIHLDPIEKKPFYHFVPGTQIVSVAHGGCNLRCLNCQNASISQARPEDVFELEALPADLVSTTLERGVPSIAYTYSEPLVAFEYVRDTATLARERGLRNAIVTAGFVNPRPLREIARVTDAVTLDVKAFEPALFRSISSGRVEPVLRGLEILRGEGVWVELSFLMVPTLSDSARDVAALARWTARTLGRGTPLHILRFHPEHRLAHLPSTPVAVMEDARLRAMEAGLDFVYLGNVPGHESNHTYCPGCRRVVIERNGWTIERNVLVDARCPCGTAIAGVFA